MTIKTIYTRFPDGLHGVLPYLGGVLGDKCIIAIDADTEADRAATLHEALARLALGSLYTKEEALTLETDPVEEAAIQRLTMQLTIEELKALI